MSKLPNIKKLRREDLKNAPDWIENLLQPLNQFIELIYASLNNDITFSDNVLSEIKTLSFTTAADYTVDHFFKPLNFIKKFNVRYQGLILLQIVEGNSNNHTTILTSPFIDWLDMGDGTIRIYNISGLKDSTSYTLTVLGFG